MPHLTPLPDDFQPDGVATPAKPGFLTPLPDDFQPNGVGAPESVTVTAEREPGDYGAAKNFLTGLLRVPGAIIGTPAMLGHTMNWAQAQFNNGMDALTGGPGGHTGAELDKRDPVMRVLPTSEGVDKAVFGATGVTPYQPESPGGQIGQAATTALGAGFLDPAADFGVLKQGGSALKSLLQFAKKQAPQAIKSGIAGGAAQGSQQLFPETPGIAAVAALATHGGASAVEAAAKGGGGVVADAARQIVRPTEQGKIEAGRVLAKADDTLPGLATPTTTDIATAQGDVRAATNDIGPGLPDWQAGANLRAGLQSRADALKGQRSAATDAAFDAFRAQPALPATALEPFMRSPSFKKALGAANGSVLDEGGEPLTKYFAFGEDDTPIHLVGEAIPPDVLQRVRSHLGDAVKNAPGGSAAERTATMLNNRFGDFLDQQYPAAGDFPGYAAIRKGYADASRPLDPMAHGPVEKVLDTTKQFGQTRYTFPEERIPDVFLRSNATRSDLNQLVAAHGGDKEAATAALQDHLAGVAQRAVQPDGTLDAAAFDKAMLPYQKSLGNMGMWFPKLVGKFANAKAAQGALDTLMTQRDLADAVSGGALRDSNGAVTGPSFAKWLKSNREAIGRTQSPAAAMRLQGIGSALQNVHPGELADVLKSEWAPTAAGTLFGGLEGGVLATLLHKSAQTAFGGLDAKRQAAFAAAIEQAVTDPAYAARLATQAGRRGSGVSPVRALVRAIAATPLAVNAATVSP